MLPDVAFSVVQQFLLLAPKFLEEGLQLRSAAERFCPLKGVEVEILVLPGPCRCGRACFLALRSEQHGYWSVHCPGCDWSVTLGTNWWGRVGRFLIQQANLFTLGTVKCPQV